MLILYFCSPLLLDNLDQSPLVVKRRHGFPKVARMNGNNHKKAKIL